MSRAVELTGVARSFRSRSGVERPALRGVDLHIDRGVFQGLLGPNGAGKSTLIGLLCSLVRLQAGTIRVFGHDLRTEPGAAKRRIGLVPQEVNFNSFEPVAEILEGQAAYYGLSPRRARVRAQACLHRLGLADRAKQTAWGLSGGLKRRLLIARALLHEPELLVLDEPTAGVDLEARHAIHDLLRELHRDGTTILLTTHYLEEAEALCERMAILHEGALLREGPTAALLEGVVADADRSRLETLFLQLTGAATESGRQATPEGAG